MARDGKRPHNESNEHKEGVTQLVANQDLNGMAHIGDDEIDA